jgi:hypothetical protein
VIPCPRGPAPHRMSDGDACDLCFGSGALICAICTTRPAVDAEGGEPACALCLAKIKSWLAKCERLAMERNEKGAA